MHNSFAARYDAALKATGGTCPIEAGVLARLADHECPHGRLPHDHTTPCGCWPEEGATVTTLTSRRPRRRRRQPERQAA